MPTHKVLTLHFTNPKSFSECWSQIPEAAASLGIDPDSVVGLWRRFKCQSGEVLELDKSIEKPDIIVPFAGEDDTAPIMLAAWAMAKFRGTTKEIENGEIPTWMLTDCSPLEVSNSNENSN